MIVILLFATVVAKTVAINEEATAYTHINPQYLKPREEYYKPLLYHPRGEHETGRYHNNYFGQYAGDHDSHHGEYIGHSYSPSLERNIEIDNIYENRISVQEPFFPSHNVPYRYDYIPAKEAYHNVSPYVERRVDYAYNHGYEQEGHNYRLYSPAKYPITN